MSTDGPDTATSTDPGTAPGPPPAPAVFRTPRSALVAVVFLALCLSPVAFLGGPWFLLFLIPLAVAWWVLRTATVVDVDGLTARTAWGSTRWTWDRVSTLRLVDRGWVRAVGTGDAPDELVLRGVRIRDLGRLGEASGGRIAAPTPAEAQEALDHARELEAARMRIAALRERQGDGDADAGEAPGGTSPGNGDDDSESAEDRASGDDRGSDPEGRADTPADTDADHGTEASSSSGEAGRGGA